jgi:hypothetical protein
MTSPSPPPSVPPTSQNPPPRWAWALLIVLAAFIVGIGAALLDHASGASLPASILKGGAAFAGAVALLLAVVVFVLGGRRQ